uniref:Uncharacterized protein n=1 Tax=Tanacetum cinerariifolium TaxID=118510 RepID=A0A699H4F8_TANCI|nr:hypothetical protein [Tanacetum cinerariifolium]
MVEPEIPLKKKAQISLDEELAYKLQAEEEEEERIAREKAQRIEEVNLAWDDVQAKVDKRKKFFAAKRAEEKRNKPPTKAQQRNLMCPYLKNMDGWKPKALKRKSFAEIHELFDKTMKKINNFIPMDSELVEGSSKKAQAEIAQESSSTRAKDELEQESAKKQKVENDKDSAKLKRFLEIVPDDGDDVTIDATPLSSKSPTIVDYNIYKEGRKSYSQISKADEKATRKVLNWKLFDSCGVYCATMQNVVYYLRVEKMYPLTRNMLHQMWNDVRLQVDNEVEMTYDLLRLVKR